VLSAPRVSRKAASGVQRWVPILSAEINGIRLLTLDHISKNIGKTIHYLEGEYQSTVPKSFKSDKAKYLRIDEFTPSGDIEINGKVIKNWFATRKPALSDKAMIFVLSNNPNELPLQIDSKN
jgi:hypothetical protein